MIPRQRKIRANKHRSAAFFALAAPLVLTLALGIACTKSKLVQGCVKDSDCGDSLRYRCDLESGECRCRSNDACQEGEFCNSQGYCQIHVGCYETRDCPTGFFCDVASNTCLTLGHCTSDVQCQPGQLCDLVAQLCKPGCKSNGDCALRDVCLCPSTGDAGSEAACGCTGSTARERASCPVGHCSSETCGDNSFCGYGEHCVPPPEGGLPRCQSDYDRTLRPYCDNCVWSPVAGSCGKGPNFCLYSTYTSSTYCGVDCSDGQVCPNGYDCKDVIVVYYSTLCTTNEECASPAHRTSITCQTDGDCPNHGLCAKDAGAASGFCYGKCTFHEGAHQSFCACVADDDCAQEGCDPTNRTCSITERTCDPAGASCRKIRCVDQGDKGGCVVGQNCKPVEGLTCADLRNQ